MNRLLILLAVLVQACPAAPPASSAPTQPGTIASQAHLRPEYRLPEENPQTQLAPSCSQALAQADDAEDGSTLSAFRLFNSYPPTTHVASPGEVVLSPRHGRPAGLSTCLPENSFHFMLLIDGILVKGNAAQVHPLSVWELPDGLYLVAYLHRNYEMDDGEGDSIEVSGLLVDPEGHPVTPVQELSSWYEYEAAIRIRDFHYKDGRLVTTEEIFEPSNRDDNGFALGYVRDQAPRIIKEHHTEARGVPGK